MPLLSVGQIKHQQDALSSEVSEASVDPKTNVQLGPAEPFSMALIRDEFLNYSYKYIGLIDRTLQQLQSELNKTPSASSQSQVSLFMDITLILCHR